MASKGIPKATEIFRGLIEGQKKKKVCLYSDFFSLINKSHHNEPRTDNSGYYNIMYYIFKAKQPDSKLAEFSKRLYCLQVSGPKLKYNVN